MTYIVEREHSFQGHADGWYVAKSHCLYCPLCQQIWATLKFTDDTLVWSRDQICEGCFIVKDEWMPVPGSLLVEEGYGVIDTALLDALPDELLKREVELHLKAYL